MRRGKKEVKKVKNDEKTKKHTMTYTINRNKRRKIFQACKKEEKDKYRLRS